MARPSKYETHVQPKLTLIEAWARDGLTNEQIAEALDISVDSLYEYQKKYTEFSDALKRGKDEIDVLVENSLLKRAMGYEYTETTHEPLYNPISGDPILDEEGKPKIVVTKRVTKQVVPDTTAQIFWLKNRRPTSWRDKQELEHSGGMKNTVNISGLSIEELRSLAKSRSAPSG